MHRVVWYELFLSIGGLALRPATVSIMEQTM